MLNNHKKGLVIFSLFCILTLSLGAISASEDNQIDDVNLPADGNEAVIVEDHLNSENDIETNFEDSINESVLSQGASQKTITVNGGSFDDIQNAVNEANDGDTIELNGTFEGSGNTINLNKNLTICGNQNTVLDAKNLSRIIGSGGRDICIKNLRLINSLYASSFERSTCSIINCTFENAFADASGRALTLSSSNMNIINCSFINSGGAIKSILSNNTIVGCTFRGNHAELGSSISAISGRFKVINSSFMEGNGTSFYLDRVNGFEMSNCVFDAGIYIDECENIAFESCNLKNLGPFCYIDVHYSKNFSVMNCTFEDNVGEDMNTFFSSIIVRHSDCTVIDSSFRNNRADSFYCPVEVGESNCHIINSSFSNNSGGIRIRQSNASFVDCSFADISGSAVVFSSSNVSFVNCNVTDDNAISGSALLFDYSICKVDNCNFINNYAESFGAAIHIGIESILNVSNSNFINNTALGNTSTNYWWVDILDYSKHYGNSTIFVENTADVNSQLNIVNSSGLDGEGFIVPDEFKIKPYFNASDVSMYYQGGKYLTAKLYTLLETDYYLIRGANVTIKFNGQTYKRTTDNNGQIKLLINVIPGTYTAKLIFDGSNVFLKSSKSVNVQVKKVNPKLTAKAKAFKLKTKTKKYSVTLKNHKNNVMKSAKITLKVNGKTYIAKTNSKGVATFKLTKLNKKGKFNAVINYAGSKYYNKLKKTVKLTVKK